MSLKLRIEYDLPESQVAERFASRLQTAMDDTSSETPVALLTITDPDLWREWKGLGLNNASVSVIDTSCTTSTSNRAYLLSLVDKTDEKGIVASTTHFPELCSAIGLGGLHGAVRAAIGVMVSKRNKAAHTRFPGVELTKVDVDWNINAYSLTQLKRVVELDNFGTTYIGFRGGSIGRVQLLRRFVHGLVQAGLFDDPS